MYKYISYGRVLFTCCVLLMPLLATAQSVRDACETYQRPNIDCVCVAERMEVFVSKTRSDSVVDLLRQRYLNALGLDNQLATASEKLMSDPSSMISAQMAFDSVGSLPENIEDFERGCVIETSQRLDISAPLENTAAARFADARTKILGENHKRESFCLVNSMSKYMTQTELEAYHLSFSHYEGDHTNDDALSRAKKMGITKPEYEQLAQSGRKKFEKNGQRDTDYCNALTYAERFSVERINTDKESEQKRLNIKSVAATSNTASLDDRTLDDRTKAEYIMQSSCSQQGRTAQYCECLMNDFDKRVVQRAKPGVLLAWVLMRNGAEMDGQELMRLTQQSNRQDQQQAAQLFMSTLDVGDACADE